MDGCIISDEQPCMYVVRMFDGLMLFCDMYFLIKMKHITCWLWFRSLWYVLLGRESKMYEVPCSKTISLEKVVILDLDLNNFEIKV